MKPSHSAARVLFGSVSASAWIRAALLSGGLLGASARAAEPVGFNHDIRPILSDACFHCHGPDPGTRKAGLRLDTREGFFAATAKRGPAVVSGDLGKSPLWQRLVSTDVDEVMPPPEAHKDLTAAQKEVVKRWILEGAQWQPHWSFLKPEKAPLPPVKDIGWVRGGLDAFILAGLEAKGLQPNPEADRRSLARRSALDLTGLPPRPEWVEEFVRDTRSDAYERWVDRLMDTPQWGEHRARYWLDAARYADTHGLHFDNYREMWPYRDWVIGAFNRNMPFDRFTVEQIAGDLLPDPTTDQLVATGFHRCNMTTNEGGTIEEENLANYANDRVTTTSWVWLGLTANCAACHDHKFDPVSQKDFYSMAAFFRNTQQGGFDGNVKDSNPSIVVVTDTKDRARWDALAGVIESAKKTVETRKKDAEGAFDRWASGLKFPELEAALGRDLTFKAPLNEGSGTTVSVTAPSGPKTFPATGEPAWKPGGPLGASLVTDSGKTMAFADAGDFELGKPFSLGGWFFVPEKPPATGSLLARMDNTQAHRGWDLWYENGSFGSHLVNRWPENALKVRTRKALAKKGQWQHLLLTSDGSGRADGMRLYVDGVAADLEPGPSTVTGTIRTGVPLKLGQRHESDVLAGTSVQDLRSYSRALSAPEARTWAAPEAFRTLLAKPTADWPKEERAGLLSGFQAEFLPLKQAQSAIAALEKERSEIRGRYPVTHIQREKADTMPMAYVLNRGQYDQKRDAVGGAVFKALNPLPAGAPTNRLGLAQWLVSPENPLPARVTVNRFWSEVFGAGIVRTSEDLGIMGDLPSNQALLDWLAVDFMEHDWDVKRFFRQMVLSATYRQSATATKDALEKDPANRLMSRGPRFRMDAEMVRDYALAAGGLLVHKVGGASVKPYQPEGVWEAVAMPESNTKRYVPDAGESLYRRSLYTFWKRASPPALMDLFNAPSRESCSVRRERTNTPLQALATLNDPQFVEAARFLASLALRDSGNDQPDRVVDFLARRLLSRPLDASEAVVVREGYTQALAFYRQHPEDAGRLVHVGDSKPDLSAGEPLLAATTLVANQLLNLDAVLNK